MNIDDAIEYLKAEKKRGIENIIIAWWSADMFNRKDDATWAELTGLVDDNMDWATTHRALDDLMHHLEPILTEEQ